MKVLIAGSKSVDDYALVADAMKNCGFTITEVVCGNARGIDTLGYRWAQTHGKRIKQIHADWDGDGTSLGDSKLVQYCDAAVIIWDGQSRGTRRLVNAMIKSNKPYYLRLTELED